MILRDVEPGKFFCLDTRTSTVFMRVYPGIFDSQDSEITAVEVSGEGATPGTLSRLPKNVEVTLFNGKVIENPLGTRD